MNLSVCIQTHPKRRDLSEALSERLGGVEVCSDPEPATLPSAWRTYRAALEATPDGATHRCILQDDSEPCDYFMDALPAAVAAQPDKLIVLFVGGNPVEHSRRVMRACDMNLPFTELPINLFCPVVGAVWPRHHIGSFLDWVDAQKYPPQMVADDEIVGRYFRMSAKEYPLATVPSLVQHPDMVRSLIGNRDRKGLDPNRLAACFCDECDARNIDWTAGVLGIGDYY